MLIEKLEVRAEIASLTSTVTVWGPPMSLTDLGLKLILLNVESYEAKDGLGLSREIVKISFSASLITGRA
jgi:hypothetical protein